MNAKTQYGTYVATVASWLTHWKSARPLAVVVACAVALVLPTATLGAEVITDQEDYSPGATAIITGSGFAPGETVVLQVLHADGTPPTGADHDPWNVIADEDGAFTTSWHVCEDDCLGSTLQLVAAGQTSGEFAETFFTDAVFAVRLVNVQALSGGCVRTQAVTSQVFLQVGQAYRFTFSAVANGPPPLPCLASNPPILFFALGSNFGNLVFTALRSGSPASLIYTNTFVMPAAACGETFINLICDNGSTRQVQGPLPSTNAVRLVATLNCTNVLSCAGTNQPPSITCPATVIRNASNACSAVVFYPAPTANGIPAPVVTCVPATGSTFPVGDTIVTCTAVNSVGTNSCSFIVRVRDTQRPTITCPGNATVQAGPSQCSAVVLYAVGASDNCPGVTVTCTPPSGTNFPLGVTTVLCTARDASTNATSCSFLVNVVNAAPEITAVTGPSGPLALGSSASVTVDFTDADNQQTHSILFDWDDGTSDSVSVAAGIGTATQAHTYAAPGVYAVTVTVSDPCTSVSQEFQFVVIFDPNGGFVTGGGWIQSPAGAYTADPSLTGRANFGFVSKYQNGGSVPTGQTEFHFEVGELNFHSTDYEWLVVAGPLAQYKGTGTINGAGSYNFLLTARDGQANGGGGVDKFRIKIWNAGGVIYDNVQGASNDIDSADPQVIQGGSIVIHK